MNQTPERTGMGHSGKCEPNCQCDLARMGTKMNQTSESNEGIAQTCIGLKGAKRSDLTYKEVKAVDRIIEALDAKDASHSQQSSGESVTIVRGTPEVGDKTVRVTEKWLNEVEAKLSSLKGEVEADAKIREEQNSAVIRYRKEVSDLQSTILGQKGALMLQLRPVKLKNGVR